MNRYSSVVRFFAVTAFAASLLGCGSQSDDIGVPSLDGNSAQRSGIFEVDLVRGITQSEWTVMFSETRTSRNPDRVVGYRHDGSEFFTGRFTPGQTRLANILWFDFEEVLVTPEPDPDADEDDPPPEPVPVMTRRVREAVLDMTLRPRESLSGVISGQVSATLDGIYVRRRYEQVSGFAVVAGIWETIDAFGREEFRLSINSQGGFSSRSIDDDAEPYIGFIEPINTRFNLYAIEINTGCGGSEDAIGLATINPPPAGAAPSERRRLIAVVPARDGSDVCYLNVGRGPD
jgi:hypothetical protein